MIAVITIVHCVVALVASAHATLNRPSPRSGVIWILVLCFVPALGVATYLTIGLDRVRARRALIKGRARDELRNTYPDLPALTSVRNIHRIETDDPLADVHAVAQRLSQRALLGDNDFKLLRNGEETFPAMLADIAAAKHTVNCFSYAFGDDEVGQRFVDAFAEAAARGVEVRLSYDAAGSVGTSNRFFAKVRARGIRVVPFFPLNPLARRAQLYLRNHRKLLIIDGQTAYFGGTNLTVHHLAESDRSDRCLDLHVRALGPIVQQLQEVFVEDWFYAAGEELLTFGHFPDLPDRGSSVGRVVTGGPDHEYEHIQLLFFQAISSARESVRIATPYFIPGTALLLALRSAALRGVDVRLYLPGKNDHPMIRRASYAWLPRILSAGVKVFEQPPPFVHTKALMVDGNWALLGSANMDPRSFQLNYEVVVEISRSQLLSDLDDWLNEAERRSERVTLEALTSRGWLSRLVDHGAALFSPLM